MTGPTPSGPEPREQVSLEGLGIRFDDSVRIVTVNSAEVDFDSFRRGLSLCKLFHLLSNRLVDLPPVLNQEHFGGRLEQPLDLVPILSHLLGSQHAFGTRPFEAKRGHASSSNNAQFVRVE